MSLVSRFILWARARSRCRIKVVTFAGDFLFSRYEFLWPDEWDDNNWDRVKDVYPTRPRSLPWWRPFNAFVHCWNPLPGARESWHDHPRWTITVCLRGRIVERTPWGERTLTPGSVVFRTHRSIHSFEVPRASRGKTWTLFIVGRRNHRQNSFIVKPR